MTPLDQAHHRMDRAPNDDALRLRFFERLIAVELFLLLKDEALGDKIRPDLVAIEGGDYVLAFDTEARLTDFTGRQTPFAAMSGRQIVGLISGQSLGLGINPGVAPSSILLPPDAVSWLAETLANQGEEASDIPVELAPPFAVDKGLVDALDARIASASGLVKRAFLVGVTYASGRKGNLLAFVDAQDAAKGALRQSVLDAVSFSHLEISLDVGFFASNAPMVARLERAGLRFDIPEPKSAESTPLAPGMDPDKPPKLR